MKRMLLFDAFAVIHRAFHALPEFTAPDGTPVNAVYGFFSTFLKAVREIKPDYVAVAFDLPGPTNRHEVFAAYKATRPAAPEALSVQIPLVKEVVESMGVPILSSPGFEAEDIIATVADKTKKEDIEDVIVTGDHDTLQLASPRTKIYFLRKGLTDIALVDDKGVEQMYGVSPKEFIDVKALKGDPSDNIPGVVGIGEKTSVELVKRFASLENIFRNLSKLPPRVQTLLAGHEKEALANRSLVTIRCDAPLEISLDRLEWSEQNLTKAIPTLEKYRMKSLVKRIKEPSTQTTHKKRAETAGPNVEQGQLL